MDREALGRRVREVWIAWAKEQPAPKASWLLPWEELSEPDREVDRRIGATIAAEALEAAADLIEAEAKLDMGPDPMLLAIRLAAAALAPRVLRWLAAETRKGGR
jgi:hypothetical protein